MIDSIIAVTARLFDLTVPELLSRRKVRRYSHPRMMALYVARECTELSFPQIAKAFGNLHHTTVMHAMRWVADNPGCWAYIERIMKEIEDGQSERPAIERKEKAEAEERKAQEFL